ncbi:DUF1127 domain-containing protein [Pseudooceanicola sp. CBS1P-1]|uniref:DUF1127 domain-containing protein n=1 Tax=Pseudooceanicola albus TaxID=2692189 RepID=A0A6L7FZN3_9RHOB|nr:MULTISPECIES: DUF1127 domain-containing protein [Pseudooceanicola]MBT9383710.1 DUF1127 domain-containing protein [Pseudooceanicola endophyticus]MXN17564.1 DUF1127 domain-containing protein [Pseudooceanicola albus]
MAAITTNIQSAPLNFGRGILSFFGSIGRAMQASRINAELNCLSDRELADLGMKREDIRTRVAEVLGVEAQ